MKQPLIIFICLLIALTAHSQEQDIKLTIDRMFQAMYTGDTAALRTCFISSAQLLTFGYDTAGNPGANAETLEDFIQGVSRIKDVKLEERLTGWQCLVDEGIASVWTPYEFYIYEKFSHCGVNSFQLMKVRGDWKITQITDTRRTNNCLNDDASVAHIDSMMNEWHHAAAIADEKVFFGMMAEDGIYIGTDATERWLREELAMWSKKYFDRETAWDFKPLSRNIRISSDGQLAWFDELLDTWMGTCRSTGIVEKKNNDWKIIHYHLSIAVPNEKIDAYRTMIGKE